MIWVTVMVMAMIRVTVIITFMVMIRVTVRYGGCPLIP